MEAQLIPSISTQVNNRASKLTSFFHTKAKLIIDSSFCGNLLCSKCLKLGNRPSSDSKNWGANKNGPYEHCSLHNEWSSITFCHCTLESTKKTAETNMAISRHPSLFFQFKLHFIKRIIKFYFSNRVNFRYCIDLQLSITLAKLLNQKPSEYIVS